MTPLLEASGMSVAFAGIRALVDVSVSVRAGERVGLIGPNGAGKTTLFNCLLGIIRPGAGRMQLNGVDVGEWPVHRRARAGMGRTFQRVELFSDTTCASTCSLGGIRNGTGAFWKDLSAGPASPWICGPATRCGAAGHRRSLGRPYGPRRSAWPKPLGEVRPGPDAGPQVLLLDEPSSDSTG